MLRRWFILSIYFTASSSVNLNSIRDAVIKSGLSGDFVERNDQQMTSAEKLLRYISMDNIFNDENLSDNDKLFIAQSSATRFFANSLSAEINILKQLSQS